MVPHYNQLKDALKKIKARLLQVLCNKILLIRSRLQGIKGRLSLKRQIDNILRLQQRLDEISQRLDSVSKHTMEMKRERLLGLINRLEGVSPLKVLGRGYSITTTLNDAPIKSSDELDLGAKVKTRFSG